LRRHGVAETHDPSVATTVDDVRAREAVGRRRAGSIQRQHRGTRRQRSACAAAAG
jgi:hypothetical protein